MRSYYLACVIVLMFSACSKDKNIAPAPSADFTLSRTNSGDPHITATFDHATLVSSASNVKTYQWDLGDGRKSDAQNSYIDYAKAGNY